MQSNAECPIARMRNSPRPTLEPWPLAGGRAATARLKTSGRHRGSRSSRRRFRGRRHRYLNALAAIQVSGLSRQEQLAFWINLYNALTIDIVLAHYPVRSILDIDISPGLFARGPWDKSLIQVEGEALTLNDIEHRILRPIWNDPRIHYAVNCASVSCPNLQNRAFTGATVERMLDSAATAYINNQRGARIEGGQLIVSKIYDWYQEDFRGSARGVIAHLRSYGGADAGCGARRCPD
jgi:hypothetical protein